MNKQIGGYELRVDSNTWTLSIGPWMQVGLILLSVGPLILCGVVFPILIVGHPPKVQNDFLICIAIITLVVCAGVPRVRRTIKRIKSSISFDREHDVALYYGRSILPVSSIDGLCIDAVMWGGQKANTCITN